MRSRLLCVLGVLCLWSSVATAQTKSEGQQWLEDLQAEVAGDVADGKPIVVQAHVPLCDNNIIRCGNSRLGDGDNPKTNLYWRTSGGFLGWFGRRGSGWKQVYEKTGDDDILDKRIWKRTVRTSKAMRKASGKKRVVVYVVAYAWRGSKIKGAMDQYIRDLYGSKARTYTLDDGTEIEAGGAAHVVSFVGHNGWMDYSDYDFDEVARGAKKGHKKGTIAVACITEDYLAADVSAPERVPLLMTRWLLFAGAHSFEGAVTAFAQGKDLGSIRRAAIKNYAAGQGKSAKRVSGAFTNPAHGKWKHRLRGATTNR